MVAGIFAQPSMTAQPTFPKRGSISGDASDRSGTSVRSVLNSKELSPFKPKLSKDQRSLLLARSDDAAKFVGFLEGAGSGIFRLYPSTGCESLKTVSGNENCENYIPMSSNYSFRNKEHSREFQADLQLKNGFLIAGSLFSQGILVRLGDIELDRVSLSSDGLDYLSDYSPETLTGEAKVQYDQIVGGVKNDTYLYRRSLPAAENMTYGLRVIAYNGKVWRSFRGYVFDIFRGDNRIDMILVFRIVRRENNGALTVLWKELHRKDSPKITFAKN